MKGWIAGIVMLAGVLGMSACAPVDAPDGGGGAAPARRSGGPTGPLHRGGMLDDEWDYGRTFQ